MSSNIKQLVLVFNFLFFVHVSFGQSLLQELMNSKDLSSIKIDMLSDSDIQKYKSYLQTTGISEAQAEQMALQRGLPSSEALKLKLRLADNGIANKTTIVKAKNSSGRLTTNESESVNNSSINRKAENEIFGSDLFNNNDLRFEPDSRMATPKNYIIGPDDELAIDVFGYQETGFRLTVSPEGNINMPAVGYISVNGLTVEQATKRIKEKMIKNGYSRMANGQTQLAVTITKVRTIKVTIIGQVRKPGTYSLSSLSNLFNALYAAGGPNDKGSYRAIELIRNNKIIEKLDAYDFLLKGIQTNNVRLNDQDVIRIPVANVQVKLKGEIKKPGIYEILPTENLQQLLDFAQGFTNRAYTASVMIEQFTDKEKRIQDVRKSDFNRYFPHRGDEITVGEVLNRYNNRVVIDGAVYRPGAYELTDSLTLSELIIKADGLKEEAYKERGLIFRTNLDLSKEVITFDLNNLVNNTIKNINLKKDDSIVIASIKDFQNKTTITVDGEIKKPGVYAFYKGLSLKDLIFQAGGFTDAASAQRIEIARRLQGDTVSTKAIADVIEIRTGKDLSFNGSDIFLQPWDFVIVRAIPGYKAQVLVKVEGEVLYPGFYVLNTKEDKVSDIIKRAGGLSDQADKSGANITRINTSYLKDEAAEKVQKLKKNTGDTASNELIEELSKPTVKIGLRLVEILNNEGTADNITLMEGDVITVPKKRNVVKVNGEVMFPTEVVYKEGASIDYYITKAGGFTENAKKRKIYVLNANSSASRTKKVLFLKKYPKIEPGSEILVPKKIINNKKGLTTAEWLAVASGMASLAGIAVSIINVSKK